MDVMDAIRQRRSVRDYEDRPVPEEVLRKVLEAARLSPSARNGQDRRFIVVRDREQRLRLARAARGQPQVAAAPVVIAAVATKPEYVMPCGVPAFPVDLAIALDHMTLVAVEEGLGTCWIGGFYQDEARGVLGVPESYTVALLLTLGWPRIVPEARPRHALEDIVCHETFRE